MNNDTKQAEDMLKWGGRFDYKGYGNWSSHCYIKIKGNKVLCTESPYNKGTSITNMAETIAKEVCYTSNILMHDVLWVEHYVYKDMTEGYNLVTFSIRSGKNGMEFFNPK